MKPKLRRIDFRRAFLGAAFLSITLAGSVSKEPSVQAQGPARQESRADAAFEKQDFVSARDLYIQARERIQDAKNPGSGQTEWLRTTLRIVRCSMALGDMERAAEEFFLHCRLDPLAPLDHCPLPWFSPLSTSPGTRPREKTAEEWLNPIMAKSRGPSATLLAAAILYNSNESGKQQRGREHLQTLSAKAEQDAPNAESPETVLLRQAARLARVMLWKQRIPTLRSPSDLSVLQGQLEAIPQSNRAGPFYLYARAARQVGQWEDAVLAYMRIPILYPENRLLAIQSLDEAASALEKLQRLDQAANLKREAKNLTESLFPETSP